MKKHLILGLAALSMLAACNSDENVDAPSQQSRAIGFNPFLGKVTKTQQNSSTFNRFGVWGWMKNDTNNTMFMNGTEVKKATDNTGNWTYSPKQYWENGYTYRFIGLYPYGTGNQILTNFPTTFDADNYGSVTYDVGIGETDFVAAIAETDKINITEGTCPIPVDLTFHHLLSRINFAFINGMEDGSVLVIQNITVNVHRTGTVTLAKEMSNVKWETVGNETTPMTFGSATLPGDGARLTYGQVGYTTEKFIIPWMPTETKPVGKYQISFDITRYYSTMSFTYHKTIDLPIPEGGWLPGNSYLFTAELNHKNISDSGELCEIMFNVKIDNWTEYPTDPSDGVVIPGFDPTEKPTTPSDENI